MMSKVCLFFFTLAMYKCPVSLSTKAQGSSMDLGLITQSNCRVVVNDTDELINLQPLQRTDGHPRFTTVFKAQNQLWNYTFNPCVPYTLPFKNPHEPFGDRCHSVSICQYSDIQEPGFYYALVVQDKAYFKAGRDRQDLLHVELRFRGVESMRRREVVVRLVCDEERTLVEDGLFRIVKDIGRGEPVEAELHHKCCCPNGCLGKSLDESKGKKGADGGTLLILVGTVVTLLFVAAAIGGLCYIKSTQLQIYYKLPGLYNAPPSASTSGPSRMERGLNPNLSRPVAYRDYEPTTTLRKKLLPVLDDAIISVDSVELGQRLGGGIFGDTHIATWQDMTVAVKRMTINIHGNQVTEATMEFMKSEVWFHSRQRHKNIVTVVGLCLDGKHPYIITEYVNGECLKDVIKHKGTELTWPQRVKMCHGVADGMAFLHSTKPPIIHRDLRCANLFLLQDDIIKVADFGLVKLLQPVRQECLQDDCCCQRQYSACPASFRWTAPELLNHPTAQEDDAVITTACDVFSYGVIMWEIIVCADPFDHLQTEQEVMKAVQSGRRPDIPTSAEVMPQYREMLRECWCQEPQNRPTFKQVAVRLREISHQSRSFQKVVNNKHKHREQTLNVQV
ncbi:receptor-like kinase TMK2 [Haliotis rubra]|uniref:receptor-like kinase TMK2 n=1 Tax=Haliotis rubra TaxID=36100 RepID=UPI001EE5623B|nr:receptor-like kinase TMK2 [Haliotis rubra]